MNGPPPPPPSERGGPSPDTMRRIGDLRTARPVQFFKLFMPEDFVQEGMVDTTNHRAVFEGAAPGGTKHTDFEPFNMDEMYKFIGLFLCNGLSPKPSMDLWFLMGVHHRIWGNDYVAAAMDKHIPAKNKVVKGYKRWQHLRAFLCMYDIRLHAKEETEKDPLFKVRHLLNNLNYTSMNNWATGKMVSIDEQTLGFKGRHGLKLRISYKREGDGFQCDAVCDEGYTFSFYFRHGDAPQLPDSYKHHDLSPTARRVIWLARRLPNNWTAIFMDNLFNSRKLYSALYQAKALGHGVCRSSGRGTCEQVHQAEEKNKAKAEQLRGTTKAARLHNDPSCPNLLCMSTYDTKPVLILSMYETEIVWTSKSRRVWSAADKKMCLIDFLRLNAIDSYNNGMNYVDMSDQLRNQYRPDHWLRNRKWWWAFFIWGLGVSATNAWKVYDRMYDIQLGNGVDLPPKWDHREFIVQLVYDLIFPDATKKHVDEMKDMDDATFASTVTSTKSLCSFNGRVSPDIEHHDLTCESGIAAYLENVKPTTITKNRMNNGFFVRRLDRRRHPTVSVTDKVKKCQYCAYQFSNELTDRQKESFGYMYQNRHDIRRCMVCNVNLCSVCENSFHGVDMADTAAVLGIAQLPFEP